MKKTILFFSILLASCAGKQTQEIRTMERLSTASHNDYYVSNRAPLQPLQFIKLPAGSIEPEGWIRRQIELQKDGLCGHLGEISAWLQKENNAWLKNGGEWGWEEVPYWLRGYGNMAYALRDETLLKETKFWIEAILSSQRADGNFGPVHLNNGKQDFWPNMIVLWIMQSYHEYTNDNRVIDFITRYCMALKATGVNGVVMAEPAAGLLYNEDCLQYSSLFVKEIIEKVQDDHFAVVLHNCGNTGNCTQAMVYTGAAAYHFGNKIKME